MSEVSRRRLAFFSPLPPSASGIAGYVVDLLGIVPESWDIELFGPEAAAAEVAGRPAYPLEDWERREAADPFDLNVYHVGNNALHATTLPLVRRHPGLLVLHDAVLHPSRVAAYLADDDMPAYRTALEASAVADAGRIADVVGAGLGGPSIYWNEALSADLVAASRHTVVHGPLLSRWMPAQVPDATVGSVVHWASVPPPHGDLVTGWRERLGVSTGQLLGTFGYLGPEHRVDLMLDALVELGAGSDLRVVVVGRPDASLRLEQEVADRGLADRVTLVGHVDDDDFAALLHAVDLGLSLRYPTARASSAPLVQLLQAGKPTVIHDLVHLRDYPEPAVLRVPTADPAEETARLAALLGEWCGSREFRQRAAGAAAEVGASITAAAMRDSYEAAVEAALRAGDGG